MLKLFVGGIGLCLVLANAAGAESTAPPEAVALQAEMTSLRSKQIQQALAKGEAALAVLDHIPDNKLKLSLLADVAQLHLQDGDMKLALQRADQGLALAREQHDAARLRSMSILQIAIRMNKGNSVELGKEALAILKQAQSSGDTPVAIDAMKTLAKAEMAGGNFERSMKYMVDGLAMAEQIHSAEKRRSLLAALCVFYIDTKDWKKALTANLDASALAEEAGDDYLKSTLLINRSLIYSALDRPKEETATLIEAEALARIVGNNRVLMSAEINLSDTLFQRKDYKESLEMAERGLTVARRLGESTHVAVALLNRGAALNRLGDHARGLASMHEAIAMMHSTGANVAEIGSLEELSLEYEISGDLRNALKYYKQFKEQSDKLREESRSKTVQQLESRYESEKQEKRISALMAENEKRSLFRNFSILAALLGLALAAAILARYRLLRRTSGELERLNDKLQSQAVTDPLTGLHNRRFFLENVGQYIASSDRAHRPPDEAPVNDINKDLVFFMIDLDHFKFVNDTYGHAAGDMVLTQAVDRLRAGIRDSDELVRWGGEEFLLIATQTSQHQATAMAERLRGAVAAAPFDLGEGRQLSRTCSIGFAAYPLFPGAPAQPAWEQIVDLADQALYVAKESGRDGWVGTLGRKPASSTTQIPPNASSLRHLVAAEQCELVCSFSDPSALVWHAEETSEKQEEI